MEGPDNAMAKKGTTRLKNEQYKSSAPEGETDHTPPVAHVVLFLL